MSCSDPMVNLTPVLASMQSAVVVVVAVALHNPVGIP